MLTVISTMTSSLPTAVERYVRREAGAFAFEDDFLESIRDTRERGQSCARELVQDHGTSDPSRLAIATGASVATDDWTGMSSLTILGTYTEGTITIYEEQIRATANELPLSVETVRDTVIAHELAHHVMNDPLPERYSDRPGRLRRIVARVCGGTPHRERTVLVEIAAHAFAGSLIDVSPLNHPLDLIELAAERTSAASFPRGSDRTRPESRSNDAPHQPKQ